MTRVEAVARLLDEYEGTLRARERWEHGELHGGNLPPDEVAVRFVLALRQLRERILSLFEDMVPFEEINLGVHYHGRENMGKASRMRPPVPVAQADGAP